MSGSPDASARGVLLVARDLRYAWPRTPPRGWCSRKRVNGRQKRFSFLAPRKMCAPALATQPVPIIF